MSHQKINKFEDMPVWRGSLDLAVKSTQHIQKQINALQKYLNNHA